MIQLTREEVLDLLKTLSLFEGFILGLKDNTIKHIADEFINPVNLLTDKLLDS